MFRTGYKLYRRDTQRFTENSVLSLAFLSQTLYFYRLISDRSFNWHNNNTHGVVGLQSVVVIFNEFKKRFDFFFLSKRKNHQRFAAAFLSREPALRGNHGVVSIFVTVNF